MKKINFKSMKFYTGIDHTQQIEQDIRLDIANLIYKNGDIRGLDIAQRIYKSEGIVELSDDEYSIIIILVKKFCTPQVIESFNYL